jgi:N-methylhydantoinase A
MTPIAETLGVTVERAAEALVATADATMARALRRVSVERGIDPREVALVAFGGGGPLHACGLAEQLGMSRVVVPPHAGVLSAIGLALAPERRERIASHIARVGDMTAASLSDLLQRESEALHEGKQRDDGETRWWLRTRYEGQGHELDVPVAPGQTGGEAAEQFVAMHLRRTGFTLDRPVECISVRTALVGAPWPVVFHRKRGRPAIGATDAAHSTDHVDDGFDDGFEMERSVTGPAVVRLLDATMRVAPGWTARALPIGGWMMERA